MDETAATSPEPDEEGAGTIPHEEPVGVTAPPKKGEGPFRRGPRAGWPTV